MLDFDDIYRENRAKVHRYCLVLTKGDESRAEDILQQTFFKAWRKLHQFRGDAQAATWLCAIARTEFLMSLRGLEARAEHLPYIEPNDDTRGVDAIFIAHTQAPELHIMLLEAISTLPIHMRTDFINKDVYGKTCEETAKDRITACGTTKASCSRARAKIRKVLTAKAGS